MNTRHHTHRRTWLGLVSSALAVTGCAAPHVAREGDERPDSPIAAAIQRWQARLSEDGTIPPNALWNAKLHRDSMVLNRGLGGGIDPERWTWIGPGNIGGRIRPVIFHPNDPNIMWVGAASGGVWKTTNGGGLWQPMDDFMASLAVGCMVIHPTNPDVLFVGTGEGFFETVGGSSNTAAVRGAGIFRSIDGGATWQQIPSTANEDFYWVNRLAFSPADPDIMLAACGSGVWRSTDGGETWTQTSTFNALDVRYHPTDGNRAVAGGHHAEDGPWFSTDGGQSWQQATGAGGHRQELCYAPGNPSVVYAAVSEDGDRIRVWRSIDGGQTYALRTSGSGISTYASYNNTIWVDPTNPDFLILGGVWLYRSSDGGVTFAQRFNSAHADMHNIVHHPGFNGTTNRTVYFATDGGLYRTTDVYGTAVTALNNNLGITQFYGAGINPTTGRVVGGTQDNGTLRFTGDPQAWNSLFGGDGGYSAADPTDPNYFYGEVQYARIFRSTNAGGSASYIYQGITDAGTTAVNFIPYFMLDPNNPNRMLVAGRRLWRSNNVKAATPSWASIKDSIGPDDPDAPKAPDQAHFAGNDPRNISTIAVAEGNSDIIWVGHNNGEVWFTTNGTATSPAWTRVDGNSPGLPDRWVSRIVIDRINHSRVYVAVMGWEPDNVWRTDNAGQTWTRITGSGLTALPSAPASALNIHRTRPGWIYVGTDIGVFTSRNDGATWNVVTDGPGTVPVEELIWKDNATLMAVTHGRGIYLADVLLPAHLTGATVTRGQVLAGDVGSLRESDDIVLRTRSGYGATFTDLHSLEMTVLATTDRPSPTTLDLAVESRINQTTGTARLRLRNWNTTQLETISQYAIGSTEAIHTVTGLDATKYVRSDGAIELQVRHIVVVPVFAFTFESYFDWMELTAE